MGAGASSGGKPLADCVTNATAEELKTVLTEVPPDVLKKIGGVVEAAVEGPRVELSFVIEEVFRCYDADQDGLVEREEFLACREKVADLNDESSGPKQRKEWMKWYKEAGAEGTVEDGMYLSKEKWKDAFLKSAREQAGIAEEDTSSLAQWIWDGYAKQLVEFFFPAPKVDKVADGQYLPAGRKPEYPTTIPLKDLAEKLEEANRWGLRTLILTTRVSEVDTFLKYKFPELFTIDSNTIFLKHNAKQEMKSVLAKACEYEGLVCHPLLIKLADGAFDWIKFCDESFPAEIFDASLWTPKVAYERGFMSEGHCGTLDLDPNKWKMFNLIITSDFSLDEGRAKLADKIPHFDKLAILSIDPGSVEPGS